MTTQHTPEARRLGYRNGALTVIAVLLGLLALEGFMPPRAEAVVGPGDTTGLISAAQQRKLILAELKKLNTKLDDVNEALRTEIRVEVTEMPRMEAPASGE